MTEDREKRRTQALSRSPQTCLVDVRFVVWDFFWVCLTLTSEVLKGIRYGTSSITA